MAALLCGAAAWVLARPLPEVEQQRRHFAELQRQVRLAESTRAARQSDRGRVLRLQAQARAASGVHQAALTTEAAALESRVGWGDVAAVRGAVAGAPLLTVLRTTALDGFPEARPDRGTGCQACHVGIATPGLETYPAPFRTHPKFANYVGAASPHPPSRVGCASCHMGDEYASTFEGAGHARWTAERSAAAAPVRAWNVPANAGAMLPRAHVEAGCASCHLGERYQPGATALNEALVTLERSGCYGCHRIPGMEHTPRRGPDLRRLKAKLTPAWVTLWLADPRAIKPATWMPAFWSGRDVLATPQRAALDAVVAYLFEATEPVSVPEQSAQGADAGRGRALVESVGCLGCHVIGESARDGVSPRRTFGQPLQALGAKTSEAWLSSWVREPSRHSPGTRMPNLRLTESDARDVAAYLASLPSPELPTPSPAIQEDEPYRQVLVTYDRSASPETQALTGARLRAAAGRAAIDALGCFNCHEIRGFENRTTTVPIRGRQDWGTPALRALFPHSEGASGIEDASAAAAAAGLKVHPGPDFRFSAAELARVSLALAAVAGRDTQPHGLSTPWHLAKVAGRSLMQERNCVGCHPVEDAGGDLVKLVAEPTLGPPLLTPEGARVQPAWLRGFLHEPKTIRPWLAVRMPTFGLTTDEVEQVGNYLRAIAPDTPAPAAGSVGVTPEAGQALFELLKCQQCHVLGTIPKDQPTSNLAPDLRMARERLQPDWILSWLRNPGAMLPGTRMPTFWPDYPKSYYEPLGKDGTRQVRAIRDHVLTLR